jgi:hypothetical protein
MTFLMRHVQLNYLRALLLRPGSVNTLSLSHSWPPIVKSMQSPLFSLAELFMRPKRDRARCRAEQQ